MIDALKLTSGSTGRTLWRFLDHADDGTVAMRVALQKLQISPSLMLLQMAQIPSLSLTSITACASCCAFSRGVRSTWNAMRLRRFCPTPGRRFSS